jgi:DNA transformation protein and related proteins
MPNASFKDFVLDQLSALPELRARRMFGGYGIYQGEHFFAIIVEGRLYFKTDDTTRDTFIQKGMGPFTYEKDHRLISMRYFEVPPEVLEDRIELLRWANRAIDVTRLSR